MPGTIVDCDDFNCEQDCELLHKAMKGLGTDEAKIIGIISHRSNAQRQEIKKKYAQMWGKELKDALKGELSGHFEDAALALLKKPTDFDAWCLHDAMNRVGTTESTLVEVLGSRTNDEIKEITAAYQKLFYKNVGTGSESGTSHLSKDLNGENSGYFKRLVYSLSQGNRSCEVDSAAAEEDAQKLYEAGEKSLGTDESRLNVILASRSYEQLALIFNIYEKISSKTVEQALSSELSGDLYDGMIAIVKIVRDIPTYFAERLYTSMKGAGTNDKRLIRVMVSRSEIDLEDIKEVFEAKYEQSLEQFITADVSGDYKRLLVQLCRGNR